MMARRLSGRTNFEVARIPKWEWCMGKRSGVATSYFLFAVDLTFYKKTSLQTTTHYLAKLCLQSKYPAKVLSPFKKVID
jgi:hypothetical protein